MKIISIIFMITTSLCVYSKTQEQEYGEFIGTNWTTPFIVSCGLPDQMASRPPIEWAHPSEKNEIIFTLNPGDIGRCPTDNQERANAKYWERAELKQNSYLVQNTNYQINFEVKFMTGFNSDRESFFQIHSYVTDCPASPILMMKLDNSKLIIQVLKGVTKVRPMGILKNVLRTDIKIKSSDRFLSFEVLFNQKTSKISIKLDDELIVDSENFQKKKCSKPYTKFGIYRPGSLNGSQSKVAFKNILIRNIDSSETHSN